MNNVGKFSFADEKDSLNSLLHQQLLGLLLFNTCFRAEFSIIH